MAKPDCTRINQLIVAINNTRAQLKELRQQMDDLGFGTAKTLRLLVKAQKLISLLGKLPVEAWQALWEFVRCNDAGLAQLALDELKMLVQVLDAHAELLLESLPEKKDETPEDAQLRKDFERWRTELNQIVTQLAGITKPRLIDLIKAAKQAIKKAAPKVLEVLVTTFADEIKQAIVNKAFDKIKSELIDRITRRVIEYVLQRKLTEEAAKQVNKFIGLAMTGWEVLVEFAGASQASDLQEYIDQLLVKLVQLMKDCGWKWPQNAAVDPNGNEFRGFIVKGAKYQGANVQARAFVHCARLVNGKPKFGTPCRVKFESGDKVQVKLTNANQVNGQWMIPAVIDMTSVQDSPCVKNAKYCYAYLELTITLADGKTTVVLNLISGVETFP